MYEELHNGIIRLVIQKHLEQAEGADNYDSACIVALPHKNLEGLIEERTRFSAHFVDCILNLGVVFLLPVKVGNSRTIRKAGCVDEEQTGWDASCSAVSDWRGKWKDNEYWIWRK